MKLKTGAILGVLALLTACGPQEDASAPVADAQPANEQFDEAVQKMSAAYFYHVPEAATQLGVSEDVVPGTSYRMMDRSVGGNAARNRALEAALAELNEIDAESLTRERRRTYAVLTTLFDGALGPSRVVDYGTTSGAWTLWYLPYAIVQNSGPTVDIPNFLNSQQPVTNAEEAEVYLARLGSVGEALDGALESYRRGVQQGAIPPDFIVDKSLAVVEAFIEPPAGQNSLYISFVDKLETAGIEDADGFAYRALEIIDGEVIPAYQRIADYMGEIRASAPHDAGIWRLPDGEALYAAMIRHMTDSDLSADEIHQTGLDEVERISQEMDAILRAEGYTEGTVGDRIQKLNVEPRFLYSNDAGGKEALLNDVRAQVEGMYAELPNWFRRLPKHEVEVRMVPEFSQASAPIGYYNNPAPDGSRPGYYFINLRDTALHPSWTLPTLSYHEAVPGHHLDGATAMELQVPQVVKALWSNTSGEGWALYAEQLAAEMGMYADDPYGDIGRLQAELHRAVRLVTDTGMHAKKWSRERAIEYMVDVEGLDEATAISEIERYVVWPAQALGYKLGQLRILALREEAKHALGEAFDIRDFNQQVLEVASAPMPFIESTVRHWIDTEQDGSHNEYFSADQLETASGLRDAALNSSQTYDILEELVTVAPKRMAGSPGDAAAKDWAVSKLEALGFENVRVQEFQMRGWERISAEAVLNSHSDVNLDITSLGKSVSTPDGGITAEIAHFATFAELEAADAADVSGRIVFISNKMERHKDGSGYGPANIARGRGHSEAAKKGALAILIRSIGTDNHDAPHTGTMRFGDSGATVAEVEKAFDEAWNAPYGTHSVAAAAVSNVDADALQELLASGEAVSVSLDVRNRDLGEITSYNIIGEITGSSRPEEIVITGGHIDAWDTGVGAMDDGMGVAITMNAASLIGALPERPARTIRYVAFGAEEMGLIGAVAYANEYGHEDHVFGIESDFGIGPVYQLVPGVAQEAVPVLETIWSVLEPMGIGWDAAGRGGSGPDMLPLARNGMPGASLSGDGTRYFDLHHTAEDTLDKIEAADLSFNTAAYAALLYLVADYNGRFDGALER